MGWTCGLDGETDLHNIFMRKHVGIQKFPTIDIITVSSVKEKILERTYDPFLPSNASTSVDKHKLSLVQNHSYTVYVFIA
jgi:hypothetical protein